MDHSISEQYFEMLIMLPLKNSNPLINQIYLKEQSNHLITEISIIKNQDKKCAKISVYTFLPRSRYTEISHIPCPWPACLTWTDLICYLGSLKTKMNKINSVWLYCPNRFLRKLFFCDDTLSQFNDGVCKLRVSHPNSRN